MIPLISILSSFLVLISGLLLLWNKKLACVIGALAAYFYLSSVKNLLESLISLEIWLK